MYAELVCQSNFSFLQAASHPDELVQQASFYNYTAIAITDECSVAGVVRAYSHIKNNNLSIKLIVGAKFCYQDSLEFVLLAPTRQAYAELCRVITNARRRAQKGHYKLVEWDIKSIKHCLMLYLPNNNSEHNKQWLSWLTGINKHLRSKTWLTIHRHLKNTDHKLVEQLEQLSSQFKLPIVASNKALMHDKQRLPLLQVLQATEQGCSVSELGNNTLANAEACLRPFNKLSRLYKQSWLDETLKITAMCSFDLGVLKYEYPSELIPKHHTPSEYLKALVIKGAEFRFPNGIKPEIQQLIDKELKLIKEAQYEHFFITIYDIVQYAKQQNILYQGRGSAANSVVCYCLEITAVNPEKVSVLFERFISKERDQPPDIDVDFEHQRREEIFQYIYKKYGREHTAIAATVVTYRLKSAIREVGKALGIGEAQLEFFIKNINRRHFQNSWAEQLGELGLNPNTRLGSQFVNLVNEIKGFPRHLSQHVGGFIISSGPLYELVAVENAAMNDRTVIQWNKDDLEDLGLLKVDVLALGMLTAIRKSFDMIKQYYGTSLSIAQITALQNDPQVYRLIQQADTVGMFQIESRAQMSMLPRLKPKNYYDLVIQIAIVRPGPIQGGMVHPYLKRRNGIEPIEYPSKDVEEVLSRTLGVPIFQEQVIKLAMVAAGFTGGEAEQLRRAMGKWQRNGQLGQFKHKLLSGMTQRGYQLEFAERIFEQICGFGEYGFPESHSASFAVLAYVSAWLKQYFPEVFYIAILNSHPMGFYSRSQLVQDAIRHNIQVHTPCINRSSWDHKLEKQGHDFAIRLGFRIIKGLSEHSVETLTKKRESKLFTHINEVKQLSIASKDVQALASANALRELSDNRYHSRWLLMNNVQELPLFSECSEQSTGYLVAPNAIESLTEDYANLGLSVDNHPIELLRKNKLLPNYTPANKLQQVKHKSVVTVIGVVTGRQSPGTASGVTFMTLEDDTGNINVVVWKATASAQKTNFLTSKILQVTGIIEREQQVVHVIAGKLMDRSQLLAELETQQRDFR